MYTPLVSLVIPTTPDRAKFLPTLLNDIYSQDYPVLEIIWVHGEGTVGEKRNIGCEEAHGSIIMFFDSDDRYSSDWVSKSVYHLLHSMASIVGLNSAYFHDYTNNNSYLYTWDNSMYFQFLGKKTKINLLLGATLCFWKSYWQKHKFRNVLTGEDFFFTTECDNQFAHIYKEGFVASIHESNTSKRNIDASQFIPCSRPVLLGFG